MKMLKKVAAVLLAAAMSLVMLTACGGGSGSTTQYRLAKVFEGSEKTGKVYMEYGGKINGQDAIIVNATSKEGTYSKVVPAAYPDFSMEYVLNQSGFYEIGETEEGAKVAVRQPDDSTYSQLNIAMPTQENLKGIKVAPEYKLNGKTYYAEILESKGQSYTYCFEGDYLVYVVFTINTGKGDQQFVGEVKQYGTKFDSSIDDKIALNGYEIKPISTNGAQG